MYLDLFIITLIIVIIVDLSGFTTSWKSSLKKILTKGKMTSPDYSLKPFDCSFCLNFWLSLLYLLVTHNLTLPAVAYVLILSYFTMTIRDTLILLQDLFISFLDFIRHSLSTH